MDPSRQHGPRAFLISPLIPMLSHLIVSEAVGSCVRFGHSTWALWAYTQNAPAYCVSRVCTFPLGQHVLVCLLSQEPWLGGLAGAAH